MKVSPINEVKFTTSPILHTQVEQLIQYIPVVHTTGTRWRAYDEEKGHWEDVNRDIFKPLAQAVLPIEKRTPARERAILDSIENRYQVDEKMFRGALMFEDNALDRVLINVPNGIIRVTPDEIKLIEHDRRYGFTRSLAAHYEKDAHNALFDKVLRDRLPNEDDYTLFRLCVMGNPLLPDCRFEVAAVCYGEAGTGKDTCITPVIYALDGTDTHKGTVTYLTMGQICDSNCYALAKLRYSCVNFCTEMDSRAIEESANFKKLVSGSHIEAREIRQAPFTMQPHCKLVSLSNEIPRFRNGTQAEYRRLRFIPFNQAIGKIDTTVKERLKVSCPGILYMMCEGLQELLKLGGNSMPLGGEEAKSMHARFATSNDPVGNFVRVYCDMDPMAATPKSDIYDAFAAYCETNGFSEEVPVHFFRKLYDRYTQISKGREPGGARAYIIKGLRLNDKARELMSGFSL